jgi:adenylate cyclase
MATEIERKFLVIGEQWRSLGERQRYCQGYLPTQEAVTVRVRIVGERAYLTLKGPTQGMSRSEFEYDIPVQDADILLKTLCQKPWIEKWRYRIPLGDLVWEVDEFLGENQGLIIAEVELTSEDQTLELPDWIGQEVTSDRRYYNSNLVKNPYQQWSATETV